MKITYKCLKWTAFLLVWLCTNHAALAQERKVSGSVKDEQGGSLPGVNVIIKGTPNGTVTDESGNFSLNVPGPESVLVFSFIGYTTQEVSVGAQAVISVSMSPDVKTLTEVVVTGYASQEKKDITGSVGVVKAKELAQIPAPNAETLLQGRVAGVNVLQSGQPGAAASVTIRGFSSFGNNSPLYIIDGVPTLDITTLNPQDIESMNVLKDAGAASIYGSRASNGVIIVTTKKGKAGKIKVTYDMSVGTQSAGAGFKNLLNSQEMANLEWLSNKNSGLPNNSAQYGTGATPVLPDYILPSGKFEGDPAVDPKLYNIDFSKGNIYQIVKANKSGTDWYKEMTRNALIQQHNVTLSGGGESSRVMVGFNYFDQEGIVPSTYLKRYTVRANTEFTIKKVVRIGENFQASYRGSNSISNLDEGNVISQSYRIQPIVPVYDIFGGWGGTKGANLGNGSNPVATQARAAANQNFDVRSFGNVYLEADFLKNFTFRTSFGGSFQNGYYNTYTYRTYENAENNGANGFSENAYYNADWTWTNTVTYKKSFGDHNITAVAGTEAVKTGIGRAIGGSRIDFFSDDPNFRALNNGASGQKNYGTYNTPSTLYSLLGRVDYAFANKYLFSATVRRDGSSKFENQYGVFPSFTAAWRLSQESFMQGIDAINDLKIRAGYGTMGGQINVGPLNQFNLYGGGVDNSYYDLAGTSNTPAQGLWLNTIGNPGAQWEVNKTTNVGIDASLFNNRLEVIFDWYQKDTDKLLYNVQLPAAKGAGTAPYQNVASMRNRGVDLQIIYKGIISDWRYEANLTFTHYANEITAVAPGVKFFDSDGGEENRIGGRFVRNEVGYPLSSFYGYKVVGLFQNAGDVSGSPAQDGAAPGRFKYADINGDGKITPDDRTHIGNPNPNFTYGLNLTVGYKNWDLTVFLYGKQGNDIMNYTKWWTDFVPSFQGAKSKDLLYNSWSTSNPGAKTPIAETASNISTNLGVKSYYIESGSYLRARNIQLGFNFPQSMISKIGLEKARLYVQGINLFTVTNYSGLDPELGGRTVNFGIDYGNYPMTKQYLVGLNIGF